MEGLIQCGGIGQPTCEFCDIFVLISSIFNFVVIMFVPAVAAVLAVVGGFFFVISGGNPQNLERGKKILTALVIGIIIIYGSWVFVNFLFQALGVAQWQGFGTWWQIQCP